jgi:hypothetical protein
MILSSNLDHLTQETNKSRLRILLQLVWEGS